MMPTHPDLTQLPGDITGVTELFKRTTGQYVGVIFARPWSNEFVLRLTGEPEEGIKSKSYEHLLALAAIK